MATQKAVAPQVNVGAALKAAVGAFTKTTKESVKKDKTIAKQSALIAKLQAKLAGGAAKAAAPAGKPGRKAKATDADAPVAKRVKATAAAPVATEPKKRGPKPKAAAAAPAVTEPKKRGPKPKAAAVEAPAKGSKTAKAPKAKKADDEYLI
jgi:hypothetical protein